jgi:hypothetical protein
MAVAGELSTHGATQGGVVDKEAGDVYAPHELLLFSELDFGECCVRQSTLSFVASSRRCRRLSL